MATDPTLKANNITLVPGQAYQLAQLFTFNQGNDPNVTGAEVEIIPSSSSSTLSFGGATEIMSVPPYFAYDLFGPNLWAPQGGLWSSGTITVSASANPGSSIFIGLYFGYLGPNYGGRAFYPGFGDYYFSVGSAAALFTTGADKVDFNNLNPTQQAAVNSGADLYHGLGGSDSVTLPSVANYNVSLGSAGGKLGWDPSQTFVTESLAGDTYTVRGSDGSYKIALGAGSDIVTINGNGNSTITGGTGTDTIAITGTGTNTINLGTGTADITLSGSNNNIDFLTSNETVNLHLQPGLIENINGFVAGDKIVLANAGSLTLSSVFNVKSNSAGEIDLYSQNGTLFTTLIFNSSINYKSLEPVFDLSGNTGIVADPASVGPEDPSLGNINWSWIHSEESAGGQTYLEPYIPSGRLSGLTMAQGVDIGKYGNLTSLGISDYMNQLFPDWQTNPNLSFIASFSGKDNAYALSHLTPSTLVPPKPGGNPSSLSVSLTTHEANALTYFTETNIYNQLTQAYGVAAWNNLTGNQQTAIYDYAYNFGIKRPDQLGILDSGHKALWNYLLAQDWADAASAIANSGGDHARRVAEAKLLYPSYVDSKVVHGYISGATVFADANGTGQLAANDASTTTDSTGGFVLTGGSGPLIAFGGTDTSTGLPFKGQLSAPAGSTDITPLTTLLTDLASDPSAQQKILSALGLSSALNLTTFDPIAAAQGGSADGAATEVAGAKVYDTVEMIASALAGAGGTFTPSLQAAFSALASALDSSGINLNDKAALSALVTQVAQTENVQLGSGVADTIASVIAAGNAALDHVLQSDQPGSQLLKDVANVELVEQGAASTAITNAGGSLPQLQAVENLFTSTNLSDLISQGFIVIPSNISGTEGTLIAGTVVTITDANPNAPLSDFSATINWGDGTTTPGTIVAQSGGGFPVNGTHTYGEEGSYRATVTINDIGGSTTDATSTATIADAAHSIIPSSNGVAGGQTLSVSAAKGVLANDSDPDDLTVEAVDGQTKAVGHAIEGKYGSLTLNADGSYTYKAGRGNDWGDDHRWDDFHWSDDAGIRQDVFKYTVSDGHGGLSTSTLSIVVFEPGTTYLSGANTTLTAGKGPYVLDGSAGGDTLKAGSGDAVLIGGKGDTLVAGHGVDNFLFRPDFGANTIANFNVREDTLRFDDAIFHSVRDILAHTTETAVGAVISDGHGDAVTLLGVTTAQLHMHEHDFHLV